MLNFSKKYEWILNRYNSILIGKKLKEQWGYEFEIWEVGFPDQPITHFRTKTAFEMNKKINSLAKKLSK
jgi:hypothetical protein